MFIFNAILIHVPVLSFDSGDWFGLLCGFNPQSPACCMQTDPCSCTVFFFLCVVCKVRSHLAALKSSGSMATSHSTAAPPPLMSRSHSFSEPLAPSFENLHLRISQDPHQHHHHPPSSSSSSSSSSPHSHPQHRPSPHGLAPSEEVPPRVRMRKESSRPHLTKGSPSLRFFDHSFIITFYTHYLPE